MCSHRRSSYTVNFKVSVVEWTRKNEASLHTAAREFNVDRKRVRDWTQKYDELKGKCAGAPGKRRKLSTGRPPISTDLDQRVLEFLEETLTHSFLVCGISNALDGSEDDMACDDVPSIELDESLGSDSDAENADDDVDGLGDPFSEDSSSDCED